MPTLKDVIAVLDEMYNPRWADSWDAVGTVVGDPDAEVSSVLFAVDPVQAVADQAVALGVDLIVTHHPLYLKGVTSVAATTPKGRVVHTLASNGIALHTCHTNADSPKFGVSESMALALGLIDVRPLEDDLESTLDSWTVYVPHEAADRVAAAMHAAGAGQIGNYDLAQFRSQGDGSFRPLEGANPAIGGVGAVEWVPETKLELVAPAHLREDVRAAMRAAHPYEEVAHTVTEQAPAASGRGSGRIGTLPQAISLREFAHHVQQALPSHSGATRIAGDLERRIETVALCGGSGDFLLGAASARGADVYVTSDRRHHPVSEHQEEPNACAIVDVPHWSAEATWLPVVARELANRLGGTVNTHVSDIVTDPWSLTLTQGAPA
ncbi:MAG: Nif3-like dinuclear metal center hexameric protein [Actinomycetales bacterium]|nr:Nif3-like dinuclear metal center hexameric protein [Actinomycetales bacterium]